MYQNSKKILLTGGAGYIGCVLLPKLLALGHTVVLLDIFLFGEEPLSAFRHHPKLIVIKGDIRDAMLVRSLLREHQIDTVIHLAAISNDPCSELNPELTKSVNHDAVRLLAEESRTAGVTRFINASSATVYGIKDQENVTEDLPANPITLYGQYKLLSEDIIRSFCSNDFTGVSIRSATACGYSPRMRLDLVLNILTHHAIKKGAITVFGGDQMRPLIHIEDLSDLYIFFLTADPTVINGKVYNACRRNYKTIELAQLVKRVLGNNLEIRRTESEDMRSYHLCSDLLKKELGFVPQRSMATAISDITSAFNDGRITDSDAAKYYNIKMMKAIWFE